jgi:3-dehydroquinate synthase II
MQKIWVKVDPWNKDIITTALEGGADGVLVPKGYSDKVKQLGKIQTISEDGDLKTGKDVIFYTIKSGADEEEIVRLSLNKKVILESTDWTVIPLENLIAKGADVIARVKNHQEASTVCGILEKGVKHILFDSSDIKELKKTLSLINSGTDTIALEHAEIVEIKPVGMGDRVCVDTCTSMISGQGMLVGNSSSALFLVHAETVENPYVSPRPFRVNAGAVHAYTRVPGGKTKYLSELGAGDQIYITDYKGNMFPGIVGRLKIEKRPLMLIKALAAGKNITTILQNAETIRLTGTDGKPLSVVSLKKGDKVLVAIEESGRHFGHKIEETILEI